MEKLSIEKLLCNEDFTKKLVNSKTDAEIKELFKANGYDLNDEAANKIMDQIKKTLLDLKNVSQDELEKISAGNSAEDTGFKIGASVGAATGSIVGFVNGVRDVILDERIDSIDGKYRLIRPTGNEICKKAAKILWKSFVGAAFGGSAGATIGNCSGMVADALANKLVKNKYNTYYY